jgi:putative flippase GtrA
MVGAAKRLERGLMAARAAAAGHEQFLRFLVVGAVNTLFGYTMFALIYLATGMHNVAVVGATALGIVFNFFTTGRIVFGNRSWRAFLPFVAAYGVALGLNLVALNLLLLAGVPPLLGQAISLPIVVVSAYLLNAHLVFSDRG